MTPVEAAKLMMDLSKTDSSVRMTLMRIVERAGHTDIPGWVDACPEQAVEVATELVDTVEQLKHFEQLLKTGDLS